MFHNRKHIALAISIALYAGFITTAAAQAVTDANNNNIYGSQSGNGAVGATNNWIGTSTGQFFTGNYNSAIGPAAGQSATGNSNNYFGFAAGSVTNGSNNVAIGLGALNAGTGVPLGGVGQGVKPFGSGFIDANGIARGFTGSNNLVMGTNAGVLNSGLGVATNDTVVLGARATASLTGSVALGADSVANTGASIAGYVPSIATADQRAAINATTSTLAAVSVGNAATGSFRQITAVAAGTLDSDAVNVAQLKAVEAQATAGWDVSAQGGNATNVGTDSATGTTIDLNNSDGNIVVSKTATSNDVTFDLADDLEIGNSITVGNTVIGGDGISFISGGPSITSVGINAGNTVITNVAAGVAGTDAVNVDQLNATVAASEGEYYGVNSTGGGNQNNDGATGADAIASGKDAEAEGDEAVAIGYGSMATGDASLAFGSGAQALSFNSLAFGAGAVASHENSIALGAGSATTVGAQASYEGAYVGNSSSTGEMNIGGRQVTGVAAGSAASDAVNVSQLQGGVDHAITISNGYTDTQIDNVNTAITNLDNRVTNIEGDIVDIQGDITDIQGDIVDIQGDITSLDGRVTTVEGDVASLTTTVNTFDNRVTSLENGGSGPFQITQGEEYVAPVVTGANAAAGGNGAVATGDNSTAVGNQSVASGNNSTALGNQAEATATGSVAIGYAANADHANSVALGQGSATTVGAQTGYDAAYVGSSNSNGEVNIGGRTISGVAAGIAPTDAVNVNQLQGGVNYAIETANAYTDSVFSQINNDIWDIGNRVDDLERDMYSGIATAMSLKQAPYVAGKTTYYAGFGAYKDQGALGISLRRTADNGRWSLEGGFSQNRDGSGVYVGVSGVLGSD
jgi:trimeric autotransporter adhesin